jgi:hypothetical protein
MFISESELPECCLNMLPLSPFFIPPPDLLPAEEADFGSPAAPWMPGIRKEPCESDGVAFSTSVKKLLTGGKE